MEYHVFVDTWENRFSYENGFSPLESEYLCSSKSSHEAKVFAVDYANQHFFYVPCDVEEPFAEDRFEKETEGGFYLLSVEAATSE